MPATFQISDGTITVDLYDKTNNYYALEPLNLSTGDVEFDVDEVIDMAYGSARDTTDERAADNIELRSLLRQASAYWDNDQPANIAPVYLIHQAVGETDTRYCLVKAGRLATMQSSLGAQRTAASATLLLTREGYWTDVIPFSSSTISFLSTTNVYNRQERDIATRNNYVDLSSIDGDLGAAIRIFSGSNATTYRRVIIAKRTGSTTFLNEFLPHFWSNSPDFFNAGGTTLTATADAPDNEAYVTGTTAGEYDPEWRPGATAIEAYKGNFHLMAKVMITNATGTGTCNLRINGVDLAETVRDISQTDHLVDMGAIQLPTFNLPPNFDANIDTPFRFEFIMDIAGGANVTLYGWWLIPLDEGVFTMERTNEPTPVGFITGDDAVMDGMREKVYGVNDGTQDVKPYYQIAGDGVFLDAEPFQTTRLYFFWDDLTDYEHDLDADCSVDGFNRYETLRGNT